MTDDRNVFGIQILTFGAEIVHHAGRAVCPHANFTPFGRSTVDCRPEMRRNAIGIVTAQIVVDQILVDNYGKRIARIRNFFRRNITVGIRTERKVQKDRRFFHCLWHKQRNRECHRSPRRRKGNVHGFNTDLTAEVGICRMNDRPRHRHRNIGCDTVGILLQKTAHFCSALLPAFPRHGCTVHMRCNRQIIALSKHFFQIFVLLCRTAFRKFLTQNGVIQPIVHDPTEIYRTPFSALKDKAALFQ